MMEITKFFDNRKKDLSSTSNVGDDGDVLKRPRESSLGYSIAYATNMNVFTESLKFEEEMKKSSPDVW